MFVTSFLCSHELILASERVTGAPREGLWSASSKQIKLLPDSVTFYRCSAFHLEGRYATLPWTKVLAAGRWHQDLTARSVNSVDHLGYGVRFLQQRKRKLIIATRWRQKVFKI
eukprot:6204844-Pleurochrysis_carterae.AAC.1